jgi:predicted alpha/beta superfamily hydrolase
MFFVTNSIFGQYTVRIELVALPAYHPAGADVYAAGTFNGWNPVDSKYKFQHKENGELFLEMKLDKGTYEFKLTRGGWDKVECKKDGGDLQNRVLKIEDDIGIRLNVEEWKDRFPEKTKKSTAGKNVHIIDTSFLIPQLSRTRKVWIYLPESYATSKKKYPVLYMHDGQNVFDDATSYAGEWGVDETLDTLGPMTEECIVVAIDHGGIKRLNEYNPYDNDRSGKGEGEKYADFLVKTLKPWIDKNYRTNKKKEKTFIAGSSMGGLISLYAVLKYPKVFGGAGIFSPAFWTAPGIFKYIGEKGEKVKSRIYFYGGKLENETMVPDMIRAFEAMHKISKSRMEMVIRDEGKHNEATWREEFPLFYRWMVKP